MKMKVNKTDIFEMLKGILFSVVFSIVFVMIFALILKFCDAGEGVIIPVNIAIKIVSILLSCICSFKSGTKGMLKGGVVGIFFIAITYVIFAIIDKSFTENALTWYDCLSCLAAGILSGVVAVNVRRVMR